MSHSPPQSVSRLHWLGTPTSEGPLVDPSCCRRDSLVWSGLCSHPHPTQPSCSGAPAQPLPWGCMQTQACPQAEPLLASTQPSSLPWFQADTYHTRTGKGYLARIGPPLVLGTILVGKGPLEDLPDISHVVHANGIALEHSTAKGGQGQSGQGGCQRREGGSLVPQVGQRMMVPAVSRDQKTRTPRQRVQPRSHRVRDRDGDPWRGRT